MVYNNCCPCRPDFLMLYLKEPGMSGHSFGPVSGGVTSIGKQPGCISIVWITCGDCHIDWKFSNWGITECWGKLKMFMLFVFSPIMFHQDTEAIWKYCFVPNIGFLKYSLLFSWDPSARRTIRRSSLTWRTICPSGSTTQTVDAGFQHDSQSRMAVQELPI